MCWLQSSTIVGEDFDIHLFKVAKNALQSSTMVGEKFEIHFFEMVKNALQSSTMLWRKFWYSLLWSG